MFSLNSLDIALICYHILSEVRSSIILSALEKYNLLCTQEYNTTVYNAILLKYFESGNELLQTRLR